MQDLSIPSFDEWVAYCFTQGYADFHTEADSAGYDAAEARGKRFRCRGVLADYVVKLFRAPAFVADRYTDDQIGDAIWFLFGIPSEYFNDLRSEEVPQDLQVECISSVATLYTDLFDRVCCNRGTDPDGRHESKLDIAVYMIWDMDCIEGAITFSEDTPHLVEPAFNVLETILMRCRTSSCLISALHGLGHIHDYHPSRVEQITDRFLLHQQFPTWIRDYADQARTGIVQ